MFPMLFDIKKIDTRAISNLKHSIFEKMVIKTITKYNFQLS